MSGRMMEVLLPEDLAAEVCASVERGEYSSERRGNRLASAMFGRGRKR